LAAADIISLSTNMPYYNQLSAGVWGQTLVPNNSLFSVWLLEIPASSDSGSQAYRHMWVQPQWVTSGTGAGSQTTELSIGSQALNLGDLFPALPEFVIVARVMLEYSGGNWDIVQVVVIDGSSRSQASAFGGVFLSSVAITAPLGGDGTVGNPLTAPTAYTLTPAMDGAGTAGSSSQWSAGDHVHPTDTSRASFPLAMARSFWSW
jgi:hypothetical protein